MVPRSSFLPRGLVMPDTQALRAHWARMQGRWRAPSWVCLTPPMDAACAPLGVPVHDQALLQWRHWCETHAGMRARVGLSARWLLSSVVAQAGKGAAARQQAIAEAESRWAHCLGQDSATWRARWLTRTVPLPQGVLVCAAPRALLDDVLAVARHHHVAVSWIGPWWAHDLQAWSDAPMDGKPVRSLLIREPGWRVHAQASGGELTQLWAEPESSADGPVPEALVPGTATLSLTPGQAPAALAVRRPFKGLSMARARARAGAWAAALDFKALRPRPALWSWALLGAGLLSVLWLADQIDTLQARQLETQAQIKRLSRADRLERVERAVQGRAMAAEVPQAAASAPVLDAAAADEAVAMVRALAFPWPQMLQRMEQSASAAGAVMLSMSVSLDDVGRATGPSWRLQAAVRDDAAALAWADSLPAGRLASRSSLATPFTTAQGLYGLKAEVQAQTSWNSLLEVSP